VTANETIIESERYGTLRLKENQIIRFDKGIIGFLDIKSYGLAALENTPFYILHALERQVSFILVPAAAVVEGYGFEIDDETVQLLNIQSPEDVATFLIVNIIEDALYVNLKAPVLIAPEQRKGCQFVIHNMDYPIRHPLTSGKGES
jgi:flagellar assembly factor FliW